LHHQSFRSLTETRRCGHLTTKLFVCGCQPWAEEGTALLEKAAGQGHAYAADMLGQIYDARTEFEQAVKWYTKAAEAGLPSAMFALGVSLDKGEGMAAPDYPAAADWYRQGLADNACHVIINVLAPRFLG
jgi:hypothetical protein